MKDYDIEYEVSLKKYNTYGIDVTAKYVFHPDGNVELIEILKYLKKNNIPYYILGSGSNVILPDNYFNGAIIKLDLIDHIEMRKDCMYVASGVQLATFINAMLAHGFTNMAPLMGIPGTIGGAIIGNAGSYGTDIFSHLVDITFLNDNYEIKTIPAANVDHGYRYSEFKKYNCIILGATFSYFSGNVNEAKQMIKENITKRVRTQPLEYKNAGSVFKNPEGFSAGALIEECGLKGYKIGDAMVSEKHANFIVNTGNATSNDIKSLINFVKDVVYQKKGITLELEQIIVNW